jgi:hypothetical protein
MRERESATLSLVTGREIGEVIKMGRPFEPEKVNLHKVFEDGMWQVPPGRPRADTYVEIEDYDRLLALYIAARNDKDFANNYGSEREIVNLFPHFLVSPYIALYFSVSFCIY